MKQTLVYYPDIDTAVLFRGAYDKSTKKGICPYGRECIKRGYHIFPSDKDKVLELFGVTEEQKKSATEPIIAEKEIKFVFGDHANLIMFSADAPVPERCQRTFKTACKTLTEWASYNQLRDIYHNIPVTLKYWKFKKGVPYIVLTSTIQDIERFFPEIFIDDKRYAGLLSAGVLQNPQLAQKTKDILYNMDILDPSKCWDKTPEIKAEEERIRLAEEKRKRDFIEELERKRRTPRHCEYCGAPNATWRPDPYQEEINNNHECHWICDACYHDSCMEI